MIKIQQDKHVVIIVTLIIQVIMHDCIIHYGYMQYGLLHAMTLYLVHTTSLQLAHMHTIKIRHIQSIISTQNDCYMEYFGYSRY